MIYLLLLLLQWGNDCTGACDLTILEVLDGIHCSNQFVVELVEPLLESVGLLSAAYSDSELVKSELDLVNLTLSLA